MPARWRSPGHCYLPVCKLVRRGALLPCATRRPMMLERAEAFFRIGPRENLQQAQPIASSRPMAGSGLKNFGKTVSVAPERSEKPGLALCAEQADQLFGCVGLGKNRPQLGDIIGNVLRSPGLKDDL